MRNRFYLHPFFLVSLVQKLRHGEHEEAAKIAANELMIAATELGTDTDVTGSFGTASADGGGLLMLPTIKRQIELGYLISSTTLDDGEHHHERF